jgi:hypothetical protein
MCIRDRIYTITNSVSVPNLRASGHKFLIDYEDRCDINAYGLTYYHLEDGVSSHSLDPNAFNMDTIKLTFPLFNSVGIGHIAYLKVKNINTSYREWPVVASTSKSFVGVLKLVAEWASLKEEPFNSTEEIVLDCAELLKQLDISKSIIDELNDTQEDMPVYRYLKNVDNARGNFVDNPVAGPLLLSWVKSKARYRSLNAMVANMDSPPHIDSSVLNAERGNIEQSILSYCLVNDIDPEGVDANDLINTISEPANMSDRANRDIREHLFSYRAYA